jgi:chromate transporter
MPGDDPDPDPSPTAASQGRRLGEIAAVMGKLGVTAFGGPAVHLAMLREEAVRRRRWLTDPEFLDLFGAVSVVPGPGSTQLAIALSRRRAGWWGLVVGGACFITPAMLIVLALAWAYARYGSTPTGGGVLYGVEPVVVAVVAVALWKLGRSALTQPWYGILEAGALAGYFAGVNVLILLAAAGLVAAAVANRGRLHLAVLAIPVAAAPAAGRHRPGLLAVAGEFAKLGVIVFGSGYVLIAFLRRDLVTGLHWLSLRQVLDAVAAGQVTPDPVFTTATFVGYLIGGVPAALVATAAIFLPSFVMVTALEPVVGRIRRSAWAGTALGGITVAALGLMAGVTVDLGRAAVSDVLTAALALAALAVLLRWRPNAAWLVAAGAAIGIMHALL